jgi:hypothetical protein
MPKPRSHKGGTSNRDASAHPAPAAAAVAAGTSQKRKSRDHSPTSKKERTGGEKANGGGESDDDDADVDGEADNADDNTGTTGGAAATTNAADVDEESGAAHTIAGTQGHDTQGGEVGTLEEVPPPPDTGSWESTVDASGALRPGLLFALLEHYAEKKSAKGSHASNHKVFVEGLRAKHDYRAVGASGFQQKNTLLRKLVPIVLHVAHEQGVNRDSAFDSPANRFAMGACREPLARVFKKLGVAKHPIEDVLPLILSVKDWPAHQARESHQVEGADAHRRTKLANSHHHEVEHCEYAEKKCTKLEKKYTKLKLRVSFLEQRLTTLEMRPDVHAKKRKKASKPGGDSLSSSSSSSSSDSSSDS